ncbi:MAG: rRNA pseudouridine synthase [Firmicutes bacterium]|jgi:23S rRNA pseudouridine2605 synthase|nr:rRNA pseudouridine synthase [Bacillota bacterium]
MRINKYIAQSGLASRRTADELILAGKVKVNGAVMRTPGYDVQEGDEVTVEGKRVGGAEKLVYYALNKPLGYITTTSDEQGRPTVLELMTDVTARVFPVGRLDFATSGLLIMTNDGKLTQHISHPSGEVWKTYVAVVEGEVSPERLRKLRSGVDIGGYVTKPAWVNVLEPGKRSTTLEIKISEGKNRQIRKMCKAVGNPVSSLQRTAIGDIRLGRLREGQYRKLSPAEVEYLKNC